MINLDDYPKLARAWNKEGEWNDKRAMWFVDHCKNYRNGCGKDCTERYCTFARFPDNKISDFEYVEEKDDNES